MVSRLRSVSAVRDFPLGCGRNVPRVDVGPQEYTPRKVCGIRDFPPFCGRDAPAPTEEERARISSQKSLVVTQKDRTESVVLHEVAKDVSVAGTSRGKRGVGGEKLEGTDGRGSTQMREGMEIDSVSRSHDARSRVREARRFFHSVCMKMLHHDEEARSRDGKQTELKEKSITRIDLMAANIVKEKGKEVNTDKILGAVPGVEVGDEFQYRVELVIVGLHRVHQGGIDYIKHDGTILAISIVASGEYGDKLDNANFLEYSGQGGLGKDKQPEDQKLEKGNLALFNSIAKKNDVRVIRKYKGTRASHSADTRIKTAKTYFYDGLYRVVKHRVEAGPHGKQVFKFELRRRSGQPACPNLR